jgi:peptidyl-prolyl cis-trans isomerase A (cyclophilin A)
MKRLAALLLLAACDGGPAAPPPTSPAPAANANPLLDANHPEMKKQAPAEFRVRFETDKGDFAVQVTREWAPLGADRFYNLVRHGFYDSNRFFRVVPGFVTQFGLNGDPLVSAAWRNANIPDDPRKQPNARGTITFANAGPSSRTTQVFINFKDNVALDGEGRGFSPFGRVIAGMDVVDGVCADYAEGGPAGAPDQGRLQQEGNEYLRRDFPRLTYIVRARIAD